MRPGTIDGVKAEGIEKWHLYQVDMAGTQRSQESALKLWPVCSL
jgi:hypothetical protein